jgi:hypothetical protein
MQDEWTKMSHGGHLVKFTYSDELPEGKVFSDCSDCRP